MIPDSAATIRTVYGRSLLTISGDPGEHILAHQIETVTRRALLLSLEGTREIVSSRLLHQRTAPVPAAGMHRHSPTGCLPCAVAPYLTPHRKHTVEMTVLSSLLADQWSQTDARTKGATAANLRDRFKARRVDDEAMTTMLGPHWVRVMLLALIMESTPPAELLRIADTLDAPWVPGVDVTGRDYTNAAGTLARSAVIPPHRIDPSLLDGVPDNVRSLEATRSSARARRIADAWAPVVQEAARGGRVYPWERALVG